MNNKTYSSAFLTIVCLLILLVPANQVKTFQLTVPASTSKENLCFYDTVESAVTKLDQLIRYYSKTCITDDKSEIKDFQQAAKILGTAEGKSKKDHVLNIDDIDQLTPLSSKYSFAVDIRGVLTQEPDGFDKIFDLMKENFEKLAVDKAYPAFFKDEVWRFIKYIRMFNLFSAAYSDRSSCMNIIEKNVTTLLEMFNNDPLLQLDDKCLEKTEDGIKIDPFDFEKGGIAFGFWIIEDSATLIQTGVPIAQGYSNNEKIFEYSLLPKNDFMISNVVKIKEEMLELSSQSSCADYAFVLLIFEADCDAYKFSINLRLSSSNLQITQSKTVTAGFVEGLKINFLRPPVLQVKEFKPFTFSNDQAVRAMLYKSEQLLSEMKNAQLKCNDNPNCQYYSLNDGCKKCKDSFVQYNRICIDKCPLRTVQLGQSCQPCEDNCEICESTVKCTACDKKTILYNDDCVSQCPPATVENQDKNQCLPCTTNCALCKDFQQCSICNPTLYVDLDGKCVAKCPSGSYPDINPNKCLPCSKNCSQCESLGKCLQCQSGTFLKNGVCVEDCGNGFYGDTVTKVCKVCIDNCKVCSDGTTCDKCKEAYQMQTNKTCQTDCEVGQVSFNGVCIDCFDKDKCNDCDPSNVQTCTKCRDDMLLKQGKCVDTCGDYYYANKSRECEKCPINCKSCTKDKCILCNVGYYLLDDKVCTNSCPDGYIISDNICIKCQKPGECKKCSDTNLDICTTCYPGKYLQEGRCVDYCDESYFAKDPKNCEKCPTGCASCENQFSCLKCDNDFYLKGQMCVKDCGKGYVLINNQCEKCTVNNCEICDTKDKTQCITCEIPLVLDGNKCSEKCPVGAYIGPNKICLNCQSDCLECLNSKICVKCRNPKVLQDGECKEECNDGYFNNQKNICLPCENSKCKKCEITPKLCTDCLLDNYLMNNDCLSVCPDNTYPNGKICSSCPKECQTCTSSSICTSCRDNFLLFNNTCTDSCPDKTVKVISNKTCEPCLDNDCLKCKPDDQTYCLKCNSTMVLLNGDCYTNCPRTFHPENGECLPNPLNCEIAINSISCAKCDTNYNLKNGQCVEYCGDSFVAVNNQCIPCKGECLSCKPQDSSSCTQCIAALVLLDGKCRTECPDKFWKDINVCKPCLVGDCLECSDSGKTCQKCQSGFVLDENKCKPKPCEEGKVESEGRCLKCEVNNCKKCPETNVQICTECKDETFLVDEYTCDKDCLDGQFPDKSSKRCSPCIDNCMRCSDSVSCKKCDNSWLLQDNHCVKECKEGYLPTLDKCEPCNVENCSKCNEKECLQCKYPLMLFSNTCVASCPNGTYLDKSKEYICKKCPLFCTKCDSESFCTECESGKVISDNKCIDNCPDNTINIQSKCTICQTNPDCIKCLETDLTKCIECKKNLILKDNKCISDCGDEYFNNKGVCKSCLSNCKKCNDDKTCLECKDLYFLFKDQCVPSCPVQFFSQNGKCIPCAQNYCKKCTSETCLLCGSEHFLEEGTCKSRCSPGYYLFNYSVCLKCNDCLTCENGDSCLTCPKGKYLKKGKCEDDCGSGYAAIESTQECSQCIEFCEKCFPDGLEKCAICKQGYFKYGDKCVKSCPVGFYENRMSMTCEQCIDHCEICKDEKSCDKCLSPYNYFAEKNQCVITCEDGYRSEKQKCLPCEIERCKSCSADAKKCSECMSNSYKLEDSCLVQCPEEKYYIDIEKKECKKCDALCLRCDGTGCKKCEKGYVLDNHMCISNCPEGEVPVKEECVGCITKDCAVCRSEDLSICEKCINSKFLKETNVNGLIQTTCVDNCDLGEYIQEAKCKKCNNDLCEKCDNDHSCTQCRQGKVMQGVICQETCNPGFVERNGKCIECQDPSCEVCDGLNIDKCTKCKAPAKLKNQKCVSQCDDGYMENIIEPNFIKCEPCISQCLKCDNQSTCIKCDKGLFLKDGQCVSQCGDNYADKDGICKQCTQPECKKCSPSNLDQCLECSSKLFLTENSKCVENCPDKYYNRLVPSRVCLRCLDDFCLKCSPENICMKCSSNMFIHLNQCVFRCPDGYYSDENNTCHTCDDASKCKICDVSNPKKCKICSKGFLYNFTCIDQCPDGTFPNTKNECQICNASCETCQNENTCDKCRSNLVMDENNVCKDDCDTGSVAVNGKCQKCKQLPDCEKCESLDLAKCTKCDAIKFLYKGTCNDLCPEATFINGRNCIDCEPECKICQDSMTCNECKDSYIEYNGDCVDKCKVGFTNVNGHCKECKDKDKCNQCESDLTTCIECRTPYKLAGAKCIENCEISYFYNSEIKDCTKCISNCNDCDNAKSCKVCVKGFYLEPIGNTCVITCPDGYYTDEKTQKCMSCTNPKCKKCDAANPESCTECHEKGNQFMISLPDKNIEDCIPKCPDEGYFADQFKCTKCDPECKTCKSLDECTACNQGYSLQDKTCVSECLERSVSRDGICYRCQSENCKVCDAVNLNKCLKCLTGILFDNFCIENCPTGYYYNPSSQECNKCAANCKECNQKECLQCIDNFYFMENTNTCIDCIKPKLLIDNTCLNCKVGGCLECTPNDPLKCKQCDSKLLMYNSQCIGSCPDRLYKNANTCSPCDAGCEDCTGEKQCTKCQSKYVLHLGECITECPRNYADTGNGVCAKCAQNECLKCEKDLKTCQECENSILFQGQCYDKCPDLYYLSNDNICEKCSPYCLKCNEQSCLECDKGKKQKGRECVDQCGLGFIEKEKSCIPCSDEKCLQCNPFNVCEKCKEGSFLLKSEGMCKPLCPEGTFENKETWECQTCEQGCSKCQNGAACLVCSKGYFQYKDHCVTKCPEKTTTLKGECVPCLDQDCLECKPETPELCAKCPENKPSYKDICQAKCPEGTFKSDVKCIECDNKCLECVNGNSCTKCKPSFVLSNDQCLNNCPDGQVKIENQCQPCMSDKCKTCSTDTSKCLECYEPSKMISGVCLPQCPDRYVDPGDRKCKKCPNGCIDCNSLNECKTCLSGYYFYDSQCLPQCPTGYYGDCLKNVCAKCHPACAECVGPTDENCVKCSKGYFTNIRACVQPSACREGTYPGEDGTCSFCRIPNCADCVSASTCSKCSQGYSMSEDNVCRKKVTFAALFPKMALFDPYTFNTPELRSKEIIPLTNLKSAGVGSPEISFTFWIRMLSAVIYDDAVVINIQNASEQGYNYKFIIEKFGMCALHVEEFDGKTVHRLELDSCDYSSLYNWKFYLLSIGKKSTGSLVLKVYTFDDKNKLTLYSSAFDVKPKFEGIILQTAVIQINDILESTISDYQNPSGISFQLERTLLLDYTPTEEDITYKFGKNPRKCDDYFCTSCEETCMQCVDNVPPANGYCNAQKIDITKGVRQIAGMWTFNLRTNITKMLTSDAYGFATWFYITGMKDTPANGNVITVNYIGRGNVFTENSFKISIDHGQVIFYSFESYPMSNKQLVMFNKWYLIVLSIRKGSAQIWLNSKENPENSSNTLKLFNEFQTKDFVRLFDDYQFQMGSDWEGSLYNTDVYINNVPGQATLELMDSDIIFPKDCIELSKSLTCSQCKDGYIIGSDGSCVNDALKRVRTVVRRFDLWNSETEEVPLSPVALPEQFSISLWLRKKTHSNLPQNVGHNIFSIRTDDGRVIPLIREVLKDKFTSDITMQWDNVNSDKYTHTFDKEIYSYINIVLLFDRKSNTLTYSLQDFSGENLTFTKSNQYNFAVTNIILGDSTGEEVNMEVSLVNFYQVLLTSSQIEQIRKENKPKDCDSSCRDCDLTTGMCLLCGNNVANRDICSAYLIGFNKGYITNDQKSYAFLADRSGYRNTLKQQGIYSGVNSVSYAIFGHFRVFNFKNENEGQETRYRLISLGNFGKKANYGKMDMGRNIIAIDIVKNGNAMNMEFMVNDSGNITRVKEQRVNLQFLKWVSFHAAIDVKGKLFSYIVKDQQNGSTYEGNIKFADYPEKLQEIGGINVHGFFDDVSDPVYSAPNTQILSVFFSPNSGYNLTLFQKYLTKFLIEDDPKSCPENCSLCTNDNTSQLCMICNNNFVIKNGKCKPDTEETFIHPFVILSDKILTAPTEFIVEYYSLFAKTFTLAFYLRKNYLRSAYKNPIQIINKGDLSISLLTNKPNEMLVFEYTGTKYRIEIELNEKYNWNLVSFAYDANVGVVVTVINENNQKEKMRKSVKFDSPLEDNHMHIKVNPQDYEVQIYGLEIMAGAIDEKIINWPIFDCPYDCSFCDKNICRSCDYGKSSEGQCYKKFIMLQSGIYNLKKGTLHDDIQNYIPSNKPLRSNQFSVEYMFDLLVPGTYRILHITNSDNPDRTASPMFEINYSSSGFFDISYTNRIGIFKQLNTVTRVQYPTVPNNSHHYIGLAINENKITYMFFNTKNNFISGQVIIENGLDYLTNNAKVFFFIQESPDVRDLDIAYVTKALFYYDQYLSIDTFKQTAIDHAELVQQACEVGSRSACTECKADVIGMTDDGICQPAKEVEDLFGKNIYNVSRWFNFENKIEVKIPTVPMKGFSLSFWWKQNNLPSLNTGLMELSTDETAAAVFFRILYAPDNSVILRYSDDEKMVIPGIFSLDEIYSWTHIVITYDFLTGKMNALVFHPNTKRNIQVERTVKTRNEIANIGIIYLLTGYIDTKMNSQSNVSFSLNSLQFISNYLVDSNESEYYRTEKPMKCRSPCKIECVHGSCPEDQLIKKPYNLATYRMTKAVKITQDLSYLKDIPLFSVIDESATNDETFTYYLISLDIDVNAFITSSYIPNKDILFVIHNDNKEEYDALTMMDVIPNSLANFAALSLVHQNGKLNLFKGYLPWANAFEVLEIPLGGGKLTDFSRVYISILIDVFASVSKVLVIADNVIYTVDGGTTYSTPISLLSLVYHHPSITQLALNISSPRFDSDLALHAQSHVNTDFASNNCINADGNCSICIKPQSAIQSFCLKCKAGYTFYNGGCHVNSKDTKEEDDIIPVIVKDSEGNLQFQ